MKITITYKDWLQTAPDDGQSYTRVIHLNETDTLKEVFDKITAGWKNRNSVNVELHFEV
jgi:hypothetical protein